MDLIDSLRDLATKIPKLKETGLLKTEEATKNALVMPFINALGYDVFDPLEVTPELIADVGTKKGEKVDYAILLEGQPIILFECKIFGTDLASVHASQLYRYFTATSARFGVLTDGIVYRFFTDIDNANIMDKEPFLIFNMLEIKESMVEELKKFSKGQFNVDTIVTSASELKYKSLIKTYFNGLLTQPTEGFVRVILQESKAYTGRFTQAVIDEFSPLIRDAIRMFINEQAENRLKSALAGDSTSTDSAKVETEITLAVNENPIQTTEEEKEAFMIVRAIVRPVIDVGRVVMRDTQSYCAINIDDSNRRPLCRLRLNSATHKYLGVFDADKNEEKLPITTLDDIYDFAERLRTTAALYRSPVVPPALD